MAAGPKAPPPPPLPEPPRRSAADQPASGQTATTSTSVSHVLKIQGYTPASKALPNGKGLASLPFVVRGRACTSSSWRIEFFPNGDLPGRAGFVSLLAVLDRADFAVKATVGFDLLDPATGAPVPRYARASDVRGFAHLGAYFGYGDFISREELERGFLFLEDGGGESFSVRCNVTVVELCEAAAPAVPPPDLQRHLRGLLETREGADVTFLVGAEDACFSAHRCVLAARSPVFRAELYGGTAVETADGCIRIDGMRPEVFRNLLHFAYTDSLPQPSDDREQQAVEDDDDGAVAMVMEAADRYGMERLKLVCEDRLCRRIGAGTVAAKLFLAEQRGCRRLKEACFQFLLKSPASTLHSVMASDGFAHLCKSYRSVLKELVSKLVARCSNLADQICSNTSPAPKRRKTKK